MGWWDARSPSLFHTWGRELRFADTINTVEIRSDPENSAQRTESSPFNSKFIM
jgi:hypothetical protein